MLGTVIAVVAGVMALVEALFGVFLIRRGLHWSRHPEQAQAEIERNAARRGLKLEALIADQDTFHQTLQSRGQVFFVLGIFLLIIAIVMIVGGVIAVTWIAGMEQEIQQSLDDMNAVIEHPASHTNESDAANAAVIGVAGWAQLTTKVSDLPR